MQPAFDIVVLGGGISGVGTALEAARRGYAVALLERGECLRATSANSLRIMHGGFRYLQTLDLPRVLESARAQRQLLEEFPDEVLPLSCLVPLEGRGLKHPIPAACGAHLFNAIARRPGDRLGPARVLSREEAERTAPALRGHVPHGALMWFDAHLISPERLGMHLLSRLREAGGEILEHCTATAVRPTDDGRFTVEYRYGEERSRVEGTVIVNTLGPWISSAGGIPSAFDPPWCKAFNLVIDRKLDEHHAIGVRWNGRVLFAVPRGHATAFGTWYTMHAGAPDGGAPSERELDEFISAISGAYDQAGLTRAEISRVEWGILPVRTVSGGEPIVYGRERIADRDGIITVLSTKYTTFAEQAKRVMRLVERRLKRRR